MSCTYEQLEVPVRYDVADVIAWIVSRPPHVNIDSVVVRPRAQANQQTVHRSA